jgi:hypothetical protein
MKQAQNYFFLALPSLERIGPGFSCISFPLAMELKAQLESDLKIIKEPWR